MEKRNEKAVAFLKNLDIKSAALGGFDRKATFETFREFSDLYEEVLAETKNELEDKTAKLEKSKELLNRQQEILQQISQEKMTRAESAVSSEPESGQELAQESAQESTQQTEEMLELRREAEKQAQLAENLFKSNDRLRQEIEEMRRREAEYERTIAAQESAIAAAAQEQAISGKTTEEEMERIRLEKESIIRELNSLNSQIRKTISLDKTGGDGAVEGE